jgi:methionyl-tRNA formyltransferase
MEIAVLGTKTTCLRLLEALGDRVVAVVTIDDSSDTRSRLSEILEHGASAHIPTIVADSPAGAYRDLASATPAVVFVAGWYHLIAPAVLAQPAHGYIGVHYSALPSYRGSSPLVWALINGEKEVGYSLFRLTAGMDEGPLAAQGPVEVGPEDDVATVLERLDAASIAAFVGVADDLAAGTLRFAPQRAEGASYAGARRPEDGRLDWSWTAERLARFIRAQTRPYPGAFTTLDGALVRVWAARLHEEPCYGVPGQVVRLVGGSPVVACGDGTGLVLIDIEAANAPPFSLVRTRFGEAPHV